MRKKRVFDVEEIVDLVSRHQGVRRVTFTGCGDRASVVFGEDITVGPIHNPSLMLIEDRLTELAEAYGSIVTIVLHSSPAEGSVIQLEGSPRGWRQVSPIEVEWRFDTAGLFGGYRFPDLKEVEEQPAVDG